MGEACGHQQLLAVLEAQLDAGPAPIGGRALADIDGDIEELAEGTPHEFALGSLELSVEPAQDAACRAAVVVLYEARV